MNILILIVVISVVILLSNRSKLNICVALGTLMLCSYYFWWEPTPEADLNWHYHFWDDVSILSFTDVVSMNTDRVKLISSIYTEKFISTCPVFSMFVWILTFLKIKYFLPVIVAIIIYLSSYKLVYLPGNNVVLRTNAVKIGIIYALCMTNFFGLGGLRNPLAYTLFALILYYDFEGKINKIVSFLLYMLLCLVHSSCFILLGFRIIFLFFSWLNDKYVYLALFTLILGIEIVLNIVGSAGGILQAVVASDSSYLISGSGVVNGYSRTLKVVNYIWLVYLFYCYSKARPNRFTSILRYSKWILFFAILNIQNYDVFVRMSYFLLPISSIFVVDLVNEKYTRHKFKTVLFVVCSFTLLWLSFTAYTALD